MAQRRPDYRSAWWRNHNAVGLLWYWRTWPDHRNHQEIMKTLTASVLSRSESLWESKITIVISRKNTNVLVFFFSLFLFSKNVQLCYQFNNKQVGKKTKQFVKITLDLQFKASDDIKLSRFYLFLEIMDRLHKKWRFVNNGEQDCKYCVNGAPHARSLTRDGWFDRERGRSVEKRGITPLCHRYNSRFTEIISKHNVWREMSEQQRYCLKVKRITERLSPVISDHQQRLSVVQAPLPLSSQICWKPIKNDLWAAVWTWLLPPAPWGFQKPHHEVHPSVLNLKHLLNLHSFGFLSF